MKIKQNMSVIDISSFHTVIDFSSFTLTACLVFIQTTVISHLLYDDC